MRVEAALHLASQTVRVGLHACVHVDVDVDAYVVADADADESGRAATPVAS